jgi:ketol-acid reductoisomerase
MRGFTSPVNRRAVRIPLEAIMTELMLSGEIERSYRLLRLEGYASQMRYHSPTSQYGQMSRANRYDGFDVPAVMREVLSDIESGKFAEEWDAEHDAGLPEPGAPAGREAQPRGRRLRGGPARTPRRASPAPTD